ELGDPRQRQCLGQVKERPRRNHPGTARCRRGPAISLLTDDHSFPEISDLFTATWPDLPTRCQGPPGTIGPKPAEANWLRSVVFEIGFGPPLSPAATIGSPCQLLAISTLSQAFPATCSLALSPTPARTRPPSRTPSTRSRRALSSPSRPSSGEAS